ncbi:16S rRNA G966 N2-methylase RsmD [Dysgonomonas sp. PH5-45]|uniref:class I SAM-dependent methyltransferase n=1 Tax=unclassified Dysgonomonas TaxID=2630389 RepID=UPI00247543E6|nr:MULTISPECIES: class I SAM-dependent methyltransferase [unclassified Dysgonomonas]MDH6354007.1 16S rRNA G966 N2-methylase RsmD [Dysgonomonas sp. PH5-45]MDH6386909.1 16S rRNA G966 N2-methylase RsmD [Dysgonomonas sp. PH5-37]
MNKIMQEFITMHESDDVRELALQSERYPDVDMPFALTQIKGRQIAKEKIPSWYTNREVIYPQHLSLEQCSSEATAAYKAALCGGESLLDMTGGLGVDFSFMSSKFKHAVYVEEQPSLVGIAKKNFTTLGLNNTEVVQADGVEFLRSACCYDMIYLDPARRNEAGRKVVLLEDCSPNVLEIESLLEQKADNILIKLSPMLDVTKTLDSLQNIAEVHIVSYRNECKELLFFKKKAWQGEANIFCVNINGENTSRLVFSKRDEAQAVCQYTSSLKRYLYEPNASLLKAGVYKIIGQRFGLKKLHPNSHLYTSDSLCEEFPGRVFTIEASFSLNKKDIKANLSDITFANISVRNFPMKVEDIRKKIHLKDGGSNYLFATTMADEKKVLIRCSK